MEGVSLSIKRIPQNFNLLFGNIPWQMITMTGLATFWLFFDSYYFIRTIWVVIKCILGRSRKPAGPLHKHICYGICLPTDIDFMGHMNNSRYLRECDFARIAFWINSYLIHALRKKGTSIVNTANSIRYRRSLNIFDRFCIHTKLVYWEERHFYLEEQIIRTSDNFICAVNHTRQTIIKSDITAQEVINDIHGDVQCPSPPPEIDAWIRAMTFSSQGLRRSE